MCVIYLVFTKILSGESQDKSVSKILWTQIKDIDL